MRISILSRSIQVISPMLRPLKPSFLRSTMLLGLLRSSPNVPSFLAVVSFTLLPLLVFGRFLGISIRFQDAQNPCLRYAQETHIRTHMYRRSESQYQFTWKGQIDECDRKLHPCASCRISKIRRYEIIPKQYKCKCPMIRREDHAKCKCPMICREDHAKYL